MKTKLKYRSSFFSSLILLALVFFITACDDFFVSPASGVTVPNSEQKLVVFSHISPQCKEIQVFVDRTRPRTTPGSNFVPVAGNATVMIARKGYDFVELYYDEDMECFAISTEFFPIITNTYYQLKVKTPEYDWVTAECYVPEFEMGELNYGWIDHQSDINNWRLSISLTPTEEQDGAFFRLGSFTRYYTNPDNPGSPPTSTFLAEFASWLNSGSWYLHITSGLPHTLVAMHNIRTSVYDFDTHQIYENPIDSAFITVMVTDYNYYQFHKSYDYYNYWADGNPFASATYVYSNIEGGFGAFTGFNRRDFFVPKNQ